MVDLAALTAAVLARLASDSAGSGVRALLGAGAASVLLVEDLRLEVLTAHALPARPLLALRRGAVPQVDRVISRPIYTWYAYDDPAAGYGRLEALPAAIAAAYIPALAIGTVAVGDVEVSAGAHGRDTVLGLLLMPITVIIGAM